MPRRQLKPPIKLRKRYAPLIARCRELILTAPSQTSGTESGDAMITIVCKWGLREGARPHYKVPDLEEDFPTGVVIERADDYVVIRHSVIAILKWAKSKAYTSYDASDLFAQRLPIMMKLCKLELKLDRIVDSLDISSTVLDGCSVDLEQQLEEIDSADTK